MFFGETSICFILEETHILLPWKMMNFSKMASVQPLELLGGGGAGDNGPIINDHRNNKHCPIHILIHQKNALKTFSDFLGFLGKQSLTMFRLLDVRRVHPVSENKTLGKLSTPPGYTQENQARTPRESIDSFASPPKTPPGSCHYPQRRQCPHQHRRLEPAGK